MTLPIGHIMELNRYPVKSMAGERLSSVRIEAYGVYGDRSHAFIDETKEGWDRYITARDLPRLLGYRAEFAGEASVPAEGQFPLPRITADDGRVYDWDERLLQDVQTRLGRQIAMQRCRADSQELLAVDDSPILIITDRSLDKLERLTGRAADPRRFRPNLLLSVSSDDEADETQWIGRQLRIGSCRLKIVKPCERCTMITFDPDSRERDAALLRAVHEHMGLNFGMYASVIEPGTVNVGDPVMLD